MKKIIISRKLLKESEEKALKTFNTKLNSNDELYSQSKLIELSQGHDAILTSLTDKMDEETINKLPSSIKEIHFSVDDNFYTFELKKIADIGKIITALNSASIEILDMETVDQDLENIFLKLTGDKI